MNEGPDSNPSLKANAASSASKSTNASSANNESDNPVELAQPNEYGEDRDTDSEEEPEILLKVLKLDQEERDLFEAVGCGDLELANEIIDRMSFSTIQNLRITHNERGDTVFHVAVRRQGEDMLDFLFNKLYSVPVDNLIYDVLLLGIKESNVTIVQLILEVIDSYVKFKTERGSLSELPRWPNSEFPVHMTPMMLAGITRNYELITIFGARGEQIEPMYKRTPENGKGIDRKGRSCCAECFCYCRSDQLDTATFDQLAVDYQRIHEFQAKASPEMLCYYANTRKNFDPILKSFQYINELNDMKLVDVEFKDEYEAIASKLQDFALKLISKCDNPIELDFLLSRSEGYHGAHDKYPRVIMAIEMGFREFVAHPHTQATLYMEWAGDDWYQWRFLSGSEKLQQFIYRTILLPLFLLFLCGEQGNSHGKLLASPFSRCIYSFVSQVIFVCLSIAEQTLEISQPRFRKPPNKYLEIILVVFVAGQIRALVKHFFTAPKIFFRQAWNWYDGITYAMYCYCFACWALIYLREAQEESIYFERYQPAERLKWSYLDIFMVADCFLALGTVMASGKLLRYVQLHSTIGPIQVALGKMIKKVVLFVPFFVIVFAAFALAITAVYAPYLSVAEDYEPHESWGTHINTLYLMYWGLFGMTDTSTAEMGKWLVKNGTKVEAYHYATAQTAGKLLFSAYTMLGVTILFSSMLIAYMMNMFTQIINEKEINWKFSRAELWVHFSRSSVMPPPLNLIPTIWDIIYFFRTIRNVGKDRAKYFLSCNCAICLYAAIRFSPVEKQKQEDLYQDFIKSLIRRYLRHQAELESNAAASAEESNTLSEDMQELQSLFNNMLSVFRETDGDRPNKTSGFGGSSGGPDDGGGPNGGGSHGGGRSKRENGSKDRGNSMDGGTPSYGSRSDAQQDSSASIRPQNSTVINRSRQSVSNVLNLTNRRDRPQRQSDPSFDRSIGLGSRILAKNESSGRVTNAKNSKSPNLSITNLTPTMEDNRDTVLPSASKEGNIPGKTPSAVKSAVSKYMQRLSSEELPGQAVFPKGIPALGKLPERSLTAMPAKSFLNTRDARNENKGMKEDAKKEVEVVRAGSYNTIGSLEFLNMGKSRSSKGVGSRTPSQTKLFQTTNGQASSFTKFRSSLSQEKLGVTFTRGSSEQSSLVEKSPSGNLSITNSFIRNVNTPAELQPDMKPSELSIQRTPAVPPLPTPSSPQAFPIQS